MKPLSILFTVNLKKGFKMSLISEYNVNVLPNGEKKVYFLHRYDAHKIVMEEKLDWSYAKMFRVQKNNWTHDVSKWDIRLHYFNSEDKEVASYDIDLQILVFLAEPRVWAKEYIDGLDDYYVNEKEVEHA